MKRLSDNIHEAYLQALADVWDTPEYTCAPRGLAIREILNYTFTIANPVAEAIITKDLERNKVIVEYTKKETELYESGTNRVEDFAKASKFWNNIANPDGTINSAYGHLIWKKKSQGNPLYEYHNGKDYVIMPASVNVGMRSPWDWCLESLKKDKDTRQAILRFSLPEHSWMGVKDFTCTMHGNFLIRNNKLHLSMVMRSADLKKGLVYDLPWFISLMDKMVNDLKSTYPDLTKGTYTHLAHSLHIYEKDGPSILKMLGR